MPYDEIRYKNQGDIAFLTLNNPKKINALSLKMIAEITDALLKTAADETVKVIILRAAGKHFCSGHYLAEMVDGKVVGNPDDPGNELSVVLVLALLE